MTTNPTPVSTKPVPDMAVEALQNLLDGIHAGRFILRANSEGYCQSLIDAGESALRAALARPQEVAGWVMEEDIIRLEGVAETLARAGEKIVPMYASRAPVAVGVEPVQIGEGFFLPDGKWSGSASRTLGYLGMVEDDKANGCTIRPIYAFPAGAGGSVGASGEQDSFHPANAESRAVHGAIAALREIEQMSEGTTIGRIAATALGEMA